MEEANKVYRIRTKVGDDAPNVIHVPLNQTYDMFEILSLKIDQKNFYKTYNSDYGIIVGRVIANGGVGVPNAKISVFIEVSSDDTLEQRWLYNFTSSTDIDNDGVRYNLLPDEVDDFCHQDVGTFPNKRLVLDNQDVIETFDKYWKYTTTTNNSGDYMLFGVPTGSQTLHCDIDLSDCGILSQRPRDMIPKGYNADMFESPNKFRSSKNLNSLVQIVTQDKGVYVYPYWGDISNGEDNFSITRCDINIEYKFEPTAVFLGCIVTDKGNNALGANCTANEKSGKMSDLISGEGTIEMIRKTIDYKAEEFPINGNRLIDGDGVWCYQIPMNLDIVKTDEFGNLVPTDDPNKGIATRARVRFRITLDETPSDTAGRKRARYLVPNNPRMGEGEFDDELEADYEFGSSTREESYCDLFWNKVYTVKNYIPKLQKNHKDTNRKHTGIKLINHHEDNNPMPYNALTIKLSFTYRIICTLTKIVINLIEFVNQIISLVGAILCLIILIIDLPMLLLEEIADLLSIRLPLGIGKVSLLPRPVVKGIRKLYNTFTKPIKSIIEMFMPVCIGLSSEFCDDGINQITYYPGCGKFFFNFFEYKDVKILGQSLDCIWDKTTDKHEEEEEKYCNDKQLSPEECALTLTEPSNETAMLYNCVENQLAQQNDATSFNFYNDWMNGMLYAPLWYRKIQPKRSYLFGLIRKKAKDDWCSANKTYPNLRILHQCSVNRDGSTIIKNFDNNDVQMRYVKDYRCDSKCHKEYDEESGLNGLILPKETMLRQTVYYYKAVEHDASLPKNNLVESTKNGDIKLLFATDIVLLGSLNECDIHGVPQFFKSLESSTYNMPSDILFTDYEFIMTVNKDGTTGRLEYDIDSENVNKTSEMAGCDWGNTNEFGKDDGGLFYSIGCTSSSTELDTKSCINLARVCEFGVSLDMSKEIPDLQKIEDNINNIRDEEIDNDKKYNQKLITDGFISWDELYNLDERSMFATMNGNRLQTKLNEKNGLWEYDFRYLYPENFDGSLRNVMYDKTKRYSDEVNYRNNWRLETGSKDYYLFRMGNKPYYYDMDDKEDKYGFPRYENSFYFYFGLKAGKTAIEKFNSQYFAECNNTNITSEQIGIKYQANSWCIMDGNDGYVAFDFSNIPTPYSLLINGVTNPQFSYLIDAIPEEKVILIKDKTKIPLKLDDYTQLTGNMISNGVYKYSNDGVVIPMIDNGSYSASVTDANGNITEFTFKITGKYLTYHINSQSFEEPNNVLLEIFNGDFVRISQDSDGLNTDDVNNVKRKIGGVVTISDIFMNAEPIDCYKIEIISLSDDVEYNAFIKYNNGTIVHNGIEPLYYDTSHHYAFGFPMGCKDYQITITQLCIDENNNEIDSQNSVISNVTVACPIPYKMYINEIDYDVIRNFDNKTGWNLGGKLDNPTATPVDRRDYTVSINDNPWFKIDNIFYNRSITVISGTETLTIDSETIVEFSVKYTEPRSYRNINNGNVISEDDYWNDEYWRGNTENRANYEENVELYAITDDDYEYKISKDVLVNEYTDTVEHTGTDVPYNWVDDYIVDINQCENIAEFVQMVNNVLNLRKELRDKMRDTFFMSCINTSKSFIVTASTNKLPYTQTICYHPEKAVEFEDFNVLDGDELRTENVGTIDDIKIPTISYKSSIYFGDGSNDDTPCLVKIDEGMKKPYSVGIMNYSGISIPKDSNNKPFENEGDPKYIKWDSTNLVDLFNFPLIDKILVTDYIAWSAFVNIPQYGENSDKKSVTMNGLLSGFVFNGNTINGKFNQQTLNDFDLVLSDNLTNSQTTYVEKRIINGFDYGVIGNRLLEMLKSNIKLSVTRDVVVMVNNMFGYEFINPDNITEDTINVFKQKISSLVIEDNNICYYENDELIFFVSFDDILKDILAFTDYRVVSQDVYDSPMQYAFILPISTMFILQDRNGCGTNEIIEGDFAVKLSNDAVNDCHGGKKIVKFESDGNDTYFSIFKATDDNENIVYPLNLAEQNDIQLWQITDRIDNVYSQSQPQNMFSYQMKTEYLRGTNDLIDEDFVSEELISSDNEEEEYITTKGYGTTGEFIPPSNFNYPIFVVAETDNHVRALSPVYDYSNVTAKIKYGLFNKCDSSQETEYLLAIAIGNSHFYFDNYSYELSGTCQIDSVTNVEFRQERLTKPNRFIYSNIDLATYNLIKEKLSSFIGMLFSDLSDNTIITAIDYTGLKHICSVDNRSFTETVWYKFTWYGYNGNPDDYIEYPQEQGNATKDNIVIPEPEYTGSEEFARFLGWSEDQTGETIINWDNYNINVNSCKAYYAKWDTTLPTYEVTFINNDGTSLIQSVQQGGTVEPPSGRGTYYLSTDSTKTDVDFETYRVYRSVTFIEHRMFDVNWIETTLE